MISAAPSTPYDLRFELWNVPVRVHPMFWLLTAILGWNGSNDIFGVLLWVGCVFISILVHEFGHALTAKRFGGAPSVLLYGMGGLCYSQGQRTPGQRLAVILAGPAAGILLLLLTLLTASLLRGITVREHLALIPLCLGILPSDLAFIEGLRKLGDPNVRDLYRNLVQINLFWTIINLLPIWPLDGGQATQVVLAQVSPRHGIRRSHIISFITAGGLAVFLGLRSSNLFLAFFMGFFALQNYQQLQSIHESQRYGRQDEEWWRN